MASLKGVAAFVKWGIYLTFNSVLIKLVLWVTEEICKSTDLDMPLKGLEFLGCRRDKENIAKVRETKRVLYNLEFRVQSPNPNMIDTSSPL